MKKLGLILMVLSLGIGTGVMAGKKAVDTKKSSLTWTGKKVTGQHYGTIQLQDGWVDISGGKFAGGSFTIDMTTIVCNDLEGEMKGKLEGHLKSDDFFSVEKFKTAVLVIKSSEAISADDFKVNGELTIKGKTHPIVFTAKEKGGSYVAKIVVDRTLYDVRYGSGKFFEGLGDKVIYDDFTLDVVVFTK